MKNIIIMLLAIFISSCTTTYKPEGYGGGYTDMPLGGNKYNITVRGNGATGLKRVQDIAMVRAAVIAKNKGEGFFIIFNSSQDTKIHTQGSGYINAYGSYTPTTQSYKNNYHTIVIKLVPAAKAKELDAISSDVIISNLGKEVGYVPSP